MMTRLRIRRGALAAGFVVLMALLAPALRAQALTPRDRERGHTMLRAVRAQIEEHYYSAAFNGVDLDARTAAADSIIRQASSLGEVFGAIAGLTMELGDSHTFFIPPWQTVQSEYGWDMVMVGDSAFVSRVEPRSDAERQGVRVGDRVLAVNGYTPTRGNQWSLWYVFRLLRPQPGLRVVVRAPRGEPRQLDLAAEVRQRYRVVDLTGHGGGQDVYTLIREAQNEADELRPRFVEGNDVLVWKLPTFEVDADHVRDGLRRARDRSALVLDLRGNGGGPVSTLLSLLGGLRADDVVVGTQRERRRSTPLVARGSGDGAFMGQIVVLVDSRSASASEITARVMQLTRRGMVVGDRTAGAVSRGRYEQMQMGGSELRVVYGVLVADAELVMADGGKLEGVGVLPDAVVLPTAAQLAAGDDPALARALTLLGHPTDPAAAGAVLRRR
jgi:C-terminal processing protease CtpA/Prc